VAQLWVVKLYRATPTFMVKAFLFALLFAVIGLVAFAFIGPLFFHGSDARKAGAVAFPFIILICGGSGFWFGLRRK
jgi:hypothetical protein